MATITMDTSEYEAIKKTEKLLEASLENERKLSEEIKKLNEEKIKALEEAKMKVVKISMEIADNSFDVISKLKQEVRDLTKNQSELILELDKLSKEKALAKEVVEGLEERNVKLGRVINTFLEDYGKGIGYFEARSYLVKFNEFITKTLYYNDTAKH